MLARNTQIRLAGKLQAFAVLQQMVNINNSSL
jgi:hypothetical protein